MSRYLTKIICILFMLFSIQAFAKTTERQAAQVDTFMQAFISTFENRDLDTLIKFYHPHATIIGTGNDEVIQGRGNIKAAFKKDFEQHTNAQIEIERIAVSVQNNTALAAYNVKVNVEIPNSAPFQTNLRFTVGLVKHHHSWLILQSHLSAPLATQKESEAYPKDSTQ